MYNDDGDEEEEEEDSYDEELVFIKNPTFYSWDIILFFRHKICTL